MKKQNKIRLMSILISVCLSLTGCNSQSSKFCGDENYSEDAIEETIEPSEIMPEETEEPSSIESYYLSQLNSINPKFNHEEYYYDMDYLKTLLDTNETIDECSYNFDGNIGGVVDQIVMNSKEFVKNNENFTNVYNIREILDKDYEFIYVYEEDDNVLGFIQIEKHFEVVDLINIAVSEDTRRKGIASKLIQYIIDNVEHERFLLEVNSNNTSAIKLYQKFNFKEINIRKNYYSNGDAIIMERWFI